MIVNGKNSGQVHATQIVFNSDTLGKMPEGFRVQLDKHANYLKKQYGAGMRA